MRSYDTSAPDTCPSEAEKNSTTIPPHRSHDPANSLKRSDPFQFGSRYLLEEDDVFEFNAWDHVETDDAYKEYAETQYAKQRESPVSEFDKKRFNTDPARWWNLFYKNNTTNFFKDRKWLHQEFPILTHLTQSESPPSTILEVGAGAGNTAFPILAHNRNPTLKIHACDFSPKAIALIRSNPLYDERVIQADVWDVAVVDDDDESLPSGLAPASVDVVLMIFIFSALSPTQWTTAVRNIHRVLKPGGEVLFRDYARGDLAQVRFKKGRYLEENFYVRGDGTRVYFFDQDELEAIWTRGSDTGIGRDGDRGEDDDVGILRQSDDDDDDDETAKEMKEEQTGEGKKLFETVNLDVDRRLLVNRQRKLKMYRCWLQGRFRKTVG